MSGENEEKNRSFWSTLPGILTGLAALITSIGGILTILLTLGVIDGPRPQAPEQEPTSLPLILDTPFPEKDTLTNETFGSDDFEGSNPDFQTLVVKYDDNLVRITLGLIGIDDLDGEFIYMYGTYSDLVILDSSDSFRLLRDNASDGHFEELIYSGSPEIMTGSSIRLDIPIEYLPDIADKRIWGYSMQSKDRVPDEGELSFTESSQK